MIPKEFFYRYQKFDQIFHFLMYLPHLSSPQHKWKLEFVKNSVVFSLSIDFILKIFFNHSYLLYKQGYTHLSYCNFYLSKKKKKKKTNEGTHWGMWESTLATIGLHFVTMGPATNWVNIYYKVKWEWLHRMGSLLFFFFFL